MSQSLPSFASRESYLEWRTQWRRQYKKLSRQIRLTKNLFKQCFRSTTGVNPEKLRAELQRLKLEANAMLYDRQISKVRAGEQQAQRLALREAA